MISNFRGEWSPPLVKTAAALEEGIEELADACDAHHADLVSKGALAEAAASRSEHFFLELLRDFAAEKIMGRATAGDAYAKMRSRVRDREVDPYTAAEQLVAAFEPRFEDAGG